MKSCWSRPREVISALRSLHGFTERRIFLTVVLMAPWLRLVMRLPLSSVSTVMIRPVGGGGSGRTIAPARVAEIVALAQRTGYPIVRRGCLTRGLSLLWLLRRRGIDVTLAFGIGGPKDEDQGHCWLVRDGEPYLEREEPNGRFVEVLRLADPQAPNLRSRAV